MFYLWVWLKISSRYRCWPIDQVDVSIVYLYIPCHMEPTETKVHLHHLQFTAKNSIMGLFICLIWGFMVQSTQLRSCRVWLVNLLRLYQDRLRPPEQLNSTVYEPWHDKTNKMSVCPLKTQISLGIHPVWSESLLCAQWVAKDPMFLHADSEDSDQTGRMPKLIWVFAGPTHFLGFVMSWLSYDTFASNWQLC